MVVAVRLPKIRSIPMVESVRTGREKNAGLLPLGCSNADLKFSFFGSDPVRFN